MISKMDKAWVSGIVAFAAVQVQHFFGITVDPNVLAGAAFVISAAITYLVPNKKA